MFRTTSIRRHTNLKGLLSFRTRFHLSHYSTSTTSPNAATSNDTSPPAKKPSKPKAATPLRRSAFESLPIRTASPKSNIHPVFTIATAEQYVFNRLRGWPNTVLVDNPPFTALPLHDSYWIPRWQGSQNRHGEIFVFPNGTFVCWGLEESDALLFKQKVLDQVPGFEVGQLKEFETEDLEFLSDASETTRLQGDLIILGQSVVVHQEETAPRAPLPDSLVFPINTLLARYAFSQALSRSTALSALEVALDDYLSSMALLPLSLQQTGKPGMGRKELIKKLGQLMRFRQGLNLNRENFSDVPDLYWEEPELERLFKSVVSALEVNSRTKAVNNKIDYSAELQSTLRQLLTESSSHRMELVIIALIAFECIVAIVRDGPELWHMFTTTNTESDEKSTTKDSVVSTV